jgi:hypothetical protein
MTNGSFEKMDKSLVKRFKAFREKKVPPALLEGFSARVEEGIRLMESKKIQKPAPAAWKFRVPMWAPVFAVLVLASLVVVRSGIHRLPGGPELRIERSAPALISAPSSAADVQAEIAVLRELGVWTEEDEQILGEITENDWAELERNVILL